MPIDLDTFLVALYTIVDDLYQQHAASAKPVRPGPRPTVSDSEVLTLALCAQWWGRSERAFGRYVRAHWRAYFPRLLSQSAYNRRCRDLAGVLVALVPVVARELRAATAAYEVIDTVAVPLLRRCRGQHRRLFADEAAIGRGGSDRAWYYGCKLLLAVAPTGVVTGFVLAPANMADRWLADALLCWRAAPHATPLQVADLPAPRRPNGTPYVGPTGPRWPPSGAGTRSGGPYLADAGFYRSLVATVLAPRLWGPPPHAPRLSGGAGRCGQAAACPLAPSGRDDERPSDPFLWATLSGRAQPTRPPRPHCRQADGYECRLLAQSPLWPPSVGLCHSLPCLIIHITRLGRGAATRRGWVSAG